MRTVDNRLLDRLEARQTQKFALRQRCELGWEDLDRIDPLAVESVRELWTVRGRQWDHAQDEQYSDRSERFDGSGQNSSGD